MTKPISPNTLPSRDHSDEYRHRIEKVAQIKEASLNPWPARAEVNAHSTDVISEFNPEKESRVYRIAGRLVSMRSHGKSSFFHVQDGKGKIQAYIKEDQTGAEAFKLFQSYIDLGDIVLIEGPAFKTKTGEISIRVDEIELLSKCLHPLPDKFHGLSDIETIYRQRYLDLMSNAESRERFAKRSNVVRTMRSFLDEYGFMEVETPMLHPIPGGAAAKPFITHHNALDSDFYLRIAPELYLKRLVVGGFERVYEINRNFRNEGVSTRHNPEFTMLEMYTAHQDYVFAMDFTEKMLRKVVMTTCGTLVVPFGNHTLDFGQPFKRVTLHQAVLDYTDIKPHELTEQTIDATMAARKVKAKNKQASLGEKVYALFEELVEHKLIQPTFITEFPIEVSPLAKRDPNNSHVAARFELFIASMELSNGFNELNDPFDQSDRFKAQAAARTAGDDEAHYYDADYIEALEYGLPPTVGVGIGIDRLVMLVTNSTTIKDVILFPTLKKKE